MNAGRDHTLHYSSAFAIWLLTTRHHITDKEKNWVVAWKASTRNAYGLEICESECSFHGLVHQAAQSALEN